MLIQRLDKNTKRSLFIDKLINEKASLLLSYTNYLQDKNHLQDRIRFIELLEKHVIQTGIIFLFDF